MEILFVYGTLQDPTVQESLIGRVVELTSDTLEGYAINALLMPPYPVAMPHNDAQIDGHMMSVTDEELQALDTYEGRCYIRVRVFLVSGAEAWVYIGNPACYPHTQ